MRHPERRPGAPIYAHQAGPEHIGQRVSMRYMTHDPDGPRPTDVVGMLRRWDPSGRVAVERRDGSVAEFDVDAIVASRLLHGEPSARKRRTGEGPD